MDIRQQLTQARDEAARHQLNCRKSVDEADAQLAKIDAAIGALSPDGERLVDALVSAGVLCEPEAF